MPRITRLTACLILAAFCCGCGSAPADNASSPRDPASETGTDSRLDEPAGGEDPPIEITPLGQGADPDNPPPAVKSTGGEAVTRDPPSSEAQSPRMLYTPDSAPDSPVDKPDRMVAEAAPGQRGYSLEKIYYGTDRAPQIDADERSAAYRDAYRASLICVGIGLVMLVITGFVSKYRVISATLVVACCLGAGWFYRTAMLEKQQTQLDDENQNRRYGHTIHFVDGKHVLERGVCWVSVPNAVHVRGSGELEAPGLLEIQVDPKKHFQLQRVQLRDRADFLPDLRQSVQDSDAKHAFVFIHGYNVTFREAALRTAQLKYDLDFDGPAALFSWPSNGELLSYATDEETVNLTVRSGVLNEFLTDLIDETGAESIHLIAHSMGNRALTRAFEKLPDRKNSQGEKRINQLIMAAPDVNPAEFRLLAGKIEQLTRSRTLYASEKDIALLGSEILRRSTYTRLGQGGANRVVIDGVQTIDASDLEQEMFDLGHSYYVHPLVMRDLKHLLNAQQALPSRPWLTPVDNYWKFSNAAMR